MEQQQLQADRSEPTCDQDYLMPKNSRYKGAELHLYYQKQEIQNQQQGEKALADNRSRASMDPTEYGDDEEEEEEEEEDDSKFRLDEMRYSDARMGICSVCHFSISGNDASPSDFEKALLCSDGHLLCHQCVQRFDIQSDTNCVLCAATESQQSISSVSRASSVKSIKPKRRARNHPVPRPRRSQRRNEVHYGLNYGAESCEDNWEETEQEEANYEESREEFQHVQTEAKQRSYCSIVQKEESAPSKAQINGQMMTECSRRPIQCPLLDCAVNVAFSALTNHFIFDHPEVPILIVDPGEKSTLVVNFDGLVYDSSRCLALLLVSGKLSGPAAKQFNGSHIHPRYKNRLPLPILAARLHCNASHDGGETGKGNHEDGGDVVIAWVAGLDIGNSTTLRCSIQAIDSIDGEAFRSLTYTGPINSLRTAQKPKEVFLTGDCVILHDGFINHITSGCKNLNVNVTIH
ncbi:uncharacterized protein LOC100679314 isoform X2 [Nasonia vitripennis]|uniref:DUF4729 domain-containing protein n=1 Tax=Nasonia vitripennis TaxID=7425 RepID=A0A7M7GH38_NASVI|nr:uncharacterized protein LOC100679314 isoform X2 [Nasonia vitripennis]